MYNRQLQACIHNECQEYIQYNHGTTSPLCLARREPGSNMAVVVVDEPYGAETLTRGWAGRVETDCPLARGRDMLEIGVASPGFANKTCRSWKRTYDWVLMSARSK